MENGKEKFLIIDGNSILNRAFYGIRLLSTKDGVYTNAVYGFLNIYYMIMEKLNPKYVAVAFDVSKPTFRHELYSEYKGGRKSMPDELRPQLPLLKEILGYMNIKIIELEGFEADDILGTIANKNDKENILTYILSGDRDTFQLISNNTTVVMPSTKGGKTEYSYYDPALLNEKYGIKPYQIIDVKSLMGDSSDNIKGVAKVGEKTAYALVQKYDTIDNIYENIDTIEVTNSVRENLKSGKDDAFLSYKLAKIETNAPINVSYNDVTLKEPNLSELSNIFNRLSFKKFLDRYTDGMLIETEKEHIFYEDFNNYTFVNISGFTEEQIKKLLLSINSFTYFDKKCSNSSFRGNVYVLNKDIKQIMYFNIDNNNVLQLFANINTKKTGFDIKSLIKLFIDKNIKNINSFENDIKIGYFLNNSTISTISIDMIAYNLLNIVLPEINNKSKQKEIVQTSIFDMKEPSIKKGILSDEEKKYIFAYLKVISESKELIISELKEKQLYSLYTDIEMPLIETLAAIESVGMCVDKQKLIGFGNYIDEEIKKLENKIYELSNEEFNINSPKQLQEILFEKMGLVGTKKNDNGFSTDKDVLESLIEAHPIISLILEYRSLSKLKSTYVEGLISLLDENNKLHTTFMQTITATGRLSSIEPNLQNIPVKTELGGNIRDCFIASNENNKLIDADYSQIELRVLAHMSNDEKMISAFNSNKDIHTITASEVFNVPLDKVTHDLRSKAKAVNFGIVYGISEFGLAKNISSTRAEAKEFMNSYKNTYKDVISFMDEEILKCKELGYAKTLFNRRREVPEIKSANYNTRSFGERVAMNMPIQGTAADIMKIAMNNVYKDFKAKGLKSKIIMQVHDELVVEAPNDEVEIASNILKENMQQVVSFNVPLIVDINVGNTWLEAK